MRGYSAVRRLDLGAKLTVMLDVVLIGFLCAIGDAQ